MRGGSVSWISVEIGDQVYKVVSDTGSTLSIVAHKLLKQAQIRKAKKSGHKARGW